MTFSAADFAERIEKPIEYLKIVAATLPKEFDVGVQGTVVHLVTNLPRAVDANGKVILPGEGATISADYKIEKPLEIEDRHRRDAPHSEPARGLDPDQDRKPRPIECADEGWRTVSLSGPVPKHFVTPIVSRNWNVGFLTVPQIQQSNGIR